MPQEIPRHPEKSILVLSTKEVCSRKNLRDRFRGKLSLHPDNSETNAVYIKIPRLYITLPRTFACFYLHLVYKPKISRILNNFLTRSDTWQTENGHFYGHECTIIDTTSPALSFILTILHHLPTSLPSRWKESRGRRTRRRGAREKRVNDWIHFRRSQMSKLIRVLGSGSSSRSCMAKSCDDTQLQLESQRYYVTRRGVIYPARRVENRRDRRCLAVGIVLIFCYVVIIAKAAF